VAKTPEHKVLFMQGLLSCLQDNGWCLDSGVEFAFPVRATLFQEGRYKCRRLAGRDQERKRERERVIYLFCIGYKAAYSKAMPQPLQSPPASSFTLSLVVSPSTQHWPLPCATILHHAAVSHPAILPSIRLLPWLFTPTLPNTHPQVFKTRTKPNLLSSGALIRMKKFPIAGFPKNRKKVLVMEGRTPYTIHALQDVFACIHTFLGLSLPPT
jgi:hypothetical protein